MYSTSSTLARVIGLLSDSAAATLAALWPRSTASIEANRLVNDGYRAGELCDVHFLVAFDGTIPDSAFIAIRTGGFAVREQNGSLGGFVTVRARVRLRAYDLSITGARLDRIAEAHEAFATMIGAARPTGGDAPRPASADGTRAATDDVPRAVRLVSRSVAAL